MYIDARLSYEKQDTMRDTCLTNLAGICYNLTATYDESNLVFAKA